jgi:hypothetical protein
MGFEKPIFVNFFFFYGFLMDFLVFSSIFESFLWFMGISCFFEGFLRVFPAPKGRFLIMSSSGN